MSRTPRPIPSDPELEDAGADLADGVIDIGDRRLQAIGAQSRRRVGGHALERETDGEEPLDHRVVQIPGQPVPLLVDGHFLDPLVKAGVLDGDAGGEGQGFDQRLVVARELGPADLVGEVEVAVDLVAHLDGHAEERGHRGMVGREAVALRMRAQIGRPAAASGR